MSLDDSLLELADVVADLGAWVAWEQARGVRSLPAEPPLPAAQRLPVAQRLPAAPAAPSARPSRSAPPPPAPARPSPPTRAPPTRAEPPARRPAPAPGPVKLGAWASYTWVADAAEDARRLAEATEMDAVAAVFGDCTRCALCNGRKQLVFGSGAVPARLVVLAAAPSAAEDRAGQAMVDEAGQMLDNMLARVVGVPRAEVWVAHLARCMPSGGRNPRQDELSACRPFLDAQLRLAKPEFVLLLGSAAGAVLGLPEGDAVKRGVFYPLRYPGGEARALVTLHPDQLLRRPEHKVHAFEDLKRLAEAMGG